MAEGGSDNLGELGSLLWVFILLFPVILVLLWWFGCFEDDGKETFKA